MVPLETTPNCLLTSISQVDEADGKLFILDADRTRGLFVFSKEGRFLYKIGTLGKGPGEFTDLSTFSFSLDQKTVYLCPQSQKKLIAFNTDGHWICDIPTADYYSDAQFLSDNQYVLVNRRGYYFRIGDLKTQTYRDTIKWSSGLVSVGGRLLYRNVQGGYLYSATGSDTIYYIDKQSVIPKYRIDFGPNAVSAKDLMASRFAGHTIPNLLAQEGPYLETGELFYFNMMRENGAGKYLMDAVFRNNQTGELIRVQDDDVLFLASQHASGLTLQNEFVTAIDAGRFMTKADSVLNNRQFVCPEAVKAQIRQLKEDDNPVIVFYTLKWLP